jgi:hypothetical protein
VSRVAENPIFVRDAYRCAVTGRRAESVQHRIHGNRSNNRTSNLVAMSGDGTRGGHGWVEAHWDLAHKAGWTVAKNDPRDLTEIPVFLIAGPFGQGWYGLDDDAGFWAVPGSVAWQERPVDPGDGTEAKPLAQWPRPQLPRIVRR